MTMTPWTRRACLAAAGLMLSGVGASADCLRTITNRSGYLLVASQDGGPPITLLPGRSATVRLARPGTIALSASCGTGAPVAEAVFDYEAVQDRCFVRLGDRLFSRQLGAGFWGAQGTAPFTVNVPRQGDLVLGPLRGGCPVLDRRG